MKTSISIVRKAACLWLILLAIASCNEEAKYDKVEVLPPVIANFIPLEGKLGTEVTLEGENLQYVDTVYIGGGLATIKYRVNENKMVVKVNDKSKTGKITAVNNRGQYESEGAFTVLYAVPSITKLPASGVVNSQVMIEGNNLETVTKIRFGAAVADVIYQSEKELIVSVPFVADDEVKVTLTYPTANGEAQAVSTTNFTIVKPEPTVTNYPATGIAGGTIEIDGENLILIDEVILGTHSASILTKTETKITVTVPDVEVTETVALQVKYYATKTITLTDAFLIEVPDKAKIYFWENVTTYCQDVNFTDNFFNATTGDVYGPCEYQSVKNNIDFFATYSSGNATLQLNNPNNSANQTKAFKCNNVALPTEAMPNVVKFRTFDASAPAQKKYIDLVKNKTLDEINLQMLIDDEAVTITNGVVSGTASAPRYKTAFTDGDVILAVKLNSAGTEVLSVGFIHVISVTLDGNKSHWAFNCYWQK